MNDPLGVCRVQCIGNFNGDGNKNVRFQRTPSDAMLQCQPVQELHGDERLPIVLADLVDRADVGVVQGGSGACFPAEAFERLRVLSYVLGQNLQCDKAAKLGVLSLIDHTHAAATEFLDDTVVRNGLVDHWRRILRWWSAQVNETREVGSVSKESLGNIPIVLIDPVVSVNP